jgi:hypothetical protein
MSDGKRILLVGSPLHDVGRCIKPLQHDELGSSFCSQFGFAYHAATDDVHLLLTTTVTERPLVLDALELMVHQEPALHFRQCGLLGKPPLNPRRSQSERSNDEGNTNDASDIRNA